MILLRRTEYLIVGRWTRKVYERCMTQREAEVDLQARLKSECRTPDTYFIEPHETFGVIVL